MTQARIAQIILQKECEDKEKVAFITTLICGNRKIIYNIGYMTAPVELDEMTDAMTRMGKRPAHTEQAHADFEEVFGSQLLRLLIEVTEETDPLADAGLAAQNEFNKR